MLAGVLSFMGWIVLIVLSVGILIGVGVSNRRRK
jgi:hypothetical protein